MARHIREKVESQTKILCPIKIIKPGIDLQKFTLRPPSDPKEPIRRIAYIVGDRRIWDVKRLDIAFQLLRDIIDADKKHIWQLHVRGTYSSHEQYNAYCKHLERDLKISDFVVWYPERIEDMSSWLNDKDFMLLPSTKEAFSYTTAECMAKGIKPIIGDWEGAKETWEGFVCETYGQMLAEIMRGKYEPEVYRKYVEEHYDQNRYFQELDEFMGTK